MEDRDIRRRAMSDLTQIKVAELLDLLESGNKIAWDAAELVVPLILEKASDFYQFKDDAGGSQRRRAALTIAAAFVEHPDQEGLTCGITDIIAEHMAYLAHIMLAPGKKFEEMDPETEAQLERIANSGKGHQPSQPTTPTTTEAAPVEADRDRMARRVAMAAAAE
jgi:hypothetical protein